MDFQRFITLLVEAVAIISLLATLLSSIAEWVANLAGLRNDVFRRSFRRLLLDDGLYHRLVRHGAIAISLRGQPGDMMMPSRVGAQRFALALIDVVRERGRAMPAYLQTSTCPEDVTDDTVREFINAAGVLARCEYPVAPTLLQIAKSHRGSLDSLRNALAEWYDIQMEHVSDQYKSRIRRLLFVIGFLLAALFNIDAIKITAALMQSEREGQIKALSAHSKREPSERERELTELLEKSKEPPPVLGVPLGYACLSDPRPESSCAQVRRQQTYLETATKFLGLLLTAILASLGAPFWFDLLSKIGSVVQAKKSSG